MLQVILASSTSAAKIEEFEQQLRAVDLKIIDRWSAEMSDNVRLAINAHTIAEMRNTDNMTRQFFQADCIDCLWLF